MLFSEGLKKVDKVKVEGKWTSWRLGENRWIADVGLRDQHKAITITFLVVCFPSTNNLQLLIYVLSGIALKSINYLLKFPL